MTFDSSPNGPAEEVTGGPSVDAAGGGSVVLTDADVAEFAQIVREEHGIELAPEAARREAEQLLRYALLILKPPRAAERYAPS